jgi:Protein kinase domain
MPVAPSQPPRPEGDTSIDSFVRAVGRAPGIPLEAMRKPLGPGDVIASNFRIDHELGRGGMGVVLQARDLQLDRDVAIKIMRTDRWPLAAVPRLAAIFEREAKATARLNHPGIVTLHGAGRADDTLYLVLELLRGASLVRTLDQGAVAPREALRIVREVLTALAHAHAQGILHRDLKPQNVFVTEPDRRIKLLDFGLASLDAVLTDDARALALSRAGTPAYMAPEQWRGAAQDERTDLWAAGVLLHQLVTGALPFQPDGPAALERALPVTPPPTVPAPIAHVIERAIAWSPDDRYASAAEMLTALADAEAALDGARPIPDARIAGAAADARDRRTRRARVLIPLAVAAVVGGAYLAVRRVAGGPGPVPVIDEGEWRGVRTAEFPDSPFHGVIHRIDRLHYRVTFQNLPWSHAPTQDDARNEGVFELRVIDGTWHLIGEPKDVAGWCCGNFGHQDFVVAGPDRLHQVSATWGDRPDHPQHSYAPWWYERIGPIPPDAP